MAYREEHGSFTGRRQLLKVPKLGPKAFEQCAGFLRVPESDQILDNTGVHPESYEAAKTLLTLAGYDLKDAAAGKLAELPRRVETLGWAEAAQRCGVGEPTLRDIVKELLKPGRDPRDELPAPILRTDVLEMKDLKPGMVLSGTVRNVIDFGVFVDIGVHQDGLVHISKVCNKFNPAPLRGGFRGRRGESGSAGGGREEKAHFPLHARCSLGAAIRRNAPGYAVGAAFMAARRLLKNPAED